MKSCEQTRQELSLLLPGEMAPAGSRDHLIDCSDCQCFAQMVHRQTILLRSLIHPEAPSWTVRIRELGPTHATAEPRYLPGWFPNKPSAQQKAWLSLALSLGLVIATLGWWGHQPPKNGPHQALSFQRGRVDQASGALVQPRTAVPPVAFSTKAGVEAFTEKSPRPHLEAEIRFVDHLLRENQQDARKWLESYHLRVNHEVKGLPTPPNSETKELTGPQVPKHQALGPSWDTICDHVTDLATRRIPLLREGMDDGVWLLARRPLLATIKSQEAEILSWMTQYPDQTANLSQLAKGVKMALREVTKLPTRETMKKGSGSSPQSENQPQSETSFNETPATGVYP